MMIRARLSVICGSLLVAAALVGSSVSSTGCDGSGGSGASAGQCFDYTSFDGTTPTVSFATDVLPILRTSCGVSTSCHGAENPSAPEQHYLGPSKSSPDPTAAQIQLIFDQNVGVASLTNPDMNIIEPGKPDASFLMYKMDGVECDKLTCAGDLTCGTYMPQPPSDQLPQAERDTIRRWIAQGAKND